MSGVPRPSNAASARARPALASIAELHEEVRRLHRSGETDAAITLLRRMIAAVPDSLRLRRDLVTLLHAAGRPDDAQRVAVRFAADDPATWVQLVRRATRRADTDGFARAIAKLSAVAPDWPVAQHFADVADALQGGTPMARASDEYVRAVFDGYADRFDDHLGALGYRAASIVATTITRLVAGRPTPTTQPLRVADLGCGTGLVGTALAEAEPASPQTTVHRWHLTGVDLSAPMLAHAAARRVDGRRVYTELVESDLERFLDETQHHFDVVSAADTLVYVGDLRPALSGAYRALAPGGWIVATLEDGPGCDDWHVTMSGRFVHCGNWIDEVIAGAGFCDIDITSVPLRREAHRNVEGLLVTARRPVR